MGILIRSIIFCVIGLGLFAAPAEARATTYCIHDWAVPGEYDISGNFRGQHERTSVRLSQGCRVYFQIPGVFSGGPVRQSDSCLRFTFKVEGRPEVFPAEWCNDYATVPWQGREIRAKVRPMEHTQAR